MVQLGPPLVSLRIRPVFPATKPLLLSTKNTLFNCWVAKPAPWVFQLLPPSVVLRIRPLWPTNHPILGLLKNTPLRFVVPAPLAMGCHWANEDEVINKVANRA